MKPIIFNTEMVKAILEGRKTQTRRPIKPTPTVFNGRAGGEWCGHPIDGRGRKYKTPYEIGDEIYVRETFFYEWPTEECPENMNDCRIIYRADEPDYDTGESRWTPSIHMPKWASRIQLKITDIRAEKLKNITFGDCVSEGILQYIGSTRLVLASTIIDGLTPVFKKLWQSIYRDTIFKWEHDPWVWVYEFERIK